MPRASSSSSGNGIEIHGLGKSLRGKQILQGIDLVAPKGSVAVIEGDNGAGKTTLVRILATVVAPDEGTAFVNGYDVVRAGLEVRRSVGVSFANERSLYWRINSYQNLELFGRIAGLSKQDISKRSTMLLEELDLLSVASGQVARMSTGQRQRLLVARALLADPVVVILDEPFRGLDEHGIQILIGLISRRSAAGATVLIVAPLVAAVLSVADSTYRIVSGRLDPVTQNPADGAPDLMP